jgi:hypothetical protein
LRQLAAERVPEIQATPLETLRSIDGPQILRKIIRIPALAFWRWKVLTVGRSGSIFGKHLPQGIAYPVSELFAVWLDECIPQIAARMVFDSTYTGKLINRTDFCRLNQGAYEWFGPH